MKKLDERMSKKLAAHTALSLVRSGFINPEGKTEKELQDEILGWLLNNTFEIVVDHTGDILQHARNFRRLKDNQLATLFYALWFEHQLNNIVATLAEKKGLSGKDTEAMIRDTSYRAKCSWLLSVFGMKPLNIVHTNRITKLMELRNSFVHYKWKPKNEQSQKEVDTVIEQIEKSVKYVREVENKYIYKRHKRWVKKVA